MKKLFTLLFVALMAFAAQAQEINLINEAQVVLIPDNGVEYVVNLTPGFNGTDWVTTVDIVWTAEDDQPCFSFVGNFYFIIDGVCYGDPGDEPVEVKEEDLGHSEVTPLVKDSQNTYYVGNGYSYNLGIHPIISADYELGDVYAYIAKGGPVSVDELANAKTVANVRYYNMAGQEIQNANGIAIQVTTYTDGTTNAVKVIK